MSVLAVSAPTPAGAGPVPESGRGRRPEPAPADSCGNVLLRRGEFTPLAPPADASSDPRATSLSGINNRGQIVGGTYEPGATPDARGFFPIDAHHAVLRDGRGRYRRIDVPGALLTLAYDVNDRTEIVGQYIDAGRYRTPRAGFRSEPSTASCGAGARSRPSTFLARR